MVDTQLTKVELAAEALTRAARQLIGEDSITVAVVGGPEPGDMGGGYGTGIIVELHDDVHEEALRRIVGEVVHTYDVLVSIQRASPWGALGPGHFPPVEDSHDGANRTSGDDPFGRRREWR